MKSLKIYLIVNSTVFFFSLFTLQGQTEANENKFEFHSVSISPVGIFYSEFEDPRSNSSFVGPAFSAQVNFNYAKNLFGLSALAGSEEKLLGNNTDWFYEVDLLYGREYKLGERFYISGYTGAGIYSRQYDSYNRNTEGVENESFFAVPIKLKLSPMVTDRFAVGFEMQATISSQKTLFTGGLLLQYYHKSKYKR